jgi:hypothetical protein
MRKSSLPVFTAALAIALVLGSLGVSHAAKPTIGKPCVQCHTGAPDVVRGWLGARSLRFSTINVTVGNIAWVIKHDEDTKITGAASLAAISTGKEIAVTFSGDIKTARATSISVKQPYKVPEEQVAGVGYMKGMVLKGPATGGYVLIDARPAPKYFAGHIPGAVSLPYAAFDRDYDKVLPREKDTLLIFYCGGVT